MVRLVSRQLPLRSTATLAALPAMSLVPLARFAELRRSLFRSRSEKWRRGELNLQAAPSTDRILCPGIQTLYKNAGFVVRLSPLPKISDFYRKIATWGDSKMAKKPRLPSYNRRVEALVRTTAHTKNLAARAFSAARRRIATTMTRRAAEGRKPQKRAQKIYIMMVFSLRMRRAASSLFQPLLLADLEVTPPL
jgi:hypothetical protein